MKLTKRYFAHCLCRMVAGMLLVCCGEMDETYREFIKDGELIYTGRPNALTAFSGNRRVKLTWDLISDPKIIKAKVFWNNPELPQGTEPAPGQRTPGRDSAEVSIERSSAVDHIEVMIDNLEESVYTFEVYTYDKDNNSSIRTEVISDVFGTTYQNSIANRPLNKTTYYLHSRNAELDWYGAGQQVAIVEIVYTDTTGAEQTAKVTKVPVSEGRPPVFLNANELPGYKTGTGFQYRTGYLPNETAIDTFYTDYKAVAAAGVDTGMFQPTYRYKLLARHSGMALTVNDSTKNNGVFVVQAAYAGSATGMWTIKENSAGYLVLTNVNSEKDMAVQGGSNDDGAKILQWSQGSGTNDEWTLEALDTEYRYFRIINRKSGKVMEVAAGSTDEGADVQQNAWDGSEHQQFGVVKVE